MATVDSDRTTLPSSPTEPAAVKFGQLRFHKGMDYAVILLPQQATDNALARLYGIDSQVSKYGNLFAAAPDMLAALKATRVYVETLEKHLDPVTDPGAPTIREHGAMVRAAIAKAEGR